MKNVSRGLDLPALQQEKNEIKQHPYFSDKHLWRVATCRLCLDRHDRSAVRTCWSRVCYPAGGTLKRKVYKINRIDFIDLKPGSSDRLLHIF